FGAIPASRSISAVMPTASLLKLRIVSSLDEQRSSEAEETSMPTNRLESATRRVLSCECELERHCGKRIALRGSDGCSDLRTRNRLEPGFVAGFGFPATFGFGPAVASA